VDVSASTISLSIDLDAAIRRRKPEKRVRQLSVRRDNELTWAADLSVTGAVALVADTNVYINDAAGRLPPVVEALLERTILFHCSVCVGEIATGVANADPAHKNWNDIRSVYADVLGSIPASRLLNPEPQVWTDAGLIAGMLARTQNFQPHQRKEMLNDALILLTAAKAGLAVLTSDRDHYDLLQQLCPESRVVVY
jgi:predicted nucleic acid-binding protein